MVDMQQGQRATGAMAVTVPAEGLQGAGACQIPARPFLKWAGGKRTLVPEILKALPAAFTSYFEPFVGGGALFFALAPRIERAVLSDRNAELVATYRAVRNRTDEVIAYLRSHQAAHSAAHYAFVRSQHGIRDPVQLAARFIYLNRTCFNGLYRVNRTGRFNVPMGRYRNPVICDEKNLRAVSLALTKARLHCLDFGRINPRRGDVVYCDPPYDGTFTSYTDHGFDFTEQERLRDCCLDWKRAGAIVLVSNSDTPGIRELYGPHQLIEVSGKRSINSNGNGRGPERELLVVV